MLVKFKKDCTWCVNHKGVNFSKGQEVDIEASLACEIIQADYAEQVELVTPKKKKDVENKGKEPEENKSEEGKKNKKKSGK